MSPYDYDTTNVSYGVPGHTRHNTASLRIDPPLGLMKVGILSQNPTPDTSTYHHHHNAMLSSCALYRNALYLNNAGVSMLSRGAYNDAVDTFKDGLALMEKVINPENQVVDDEAFHFPRVQACVEKATKRLARSSNPLRPAWHVPLKNISLDGSVDPTAMKVIFREQQGALAMPIRVDDVQTEGDFDRMHEVVPAIMLMNYALAHLCLSRPSQIGGLPECALKLLDMALSVLGIGDKLMDDSWDRISEGHLFVGMVILSNICHLHMDAPDRPTELSLSIEELEILRHAASEISQQTRGEDQVAGAA